MPTIKVKVENKIALNETPQIEIVCRNSDYEIEFSFDGEWDEHITKTAYFVYNGISIPVPFNGNVCEVPVLENTTQCKVGVEAGNIKTTTSAYLPCRKSVTDEGGETPEPPTESVYNKIVELVNGIYVQVDGLCATADLSIDENYVLTIALKNADGDILSTSSVDFPIESFVVSARYDKEQKAIIFTLQSGETLTVPIDDIISGCVDEETVKKLIGEETAHFQPKTDESLATESKEIVCAINEVNEKAEQAIENANAYTDEKIEKLELTKVVSELPEVGKTNKIYLVAKPDGEGGDIFDEYIWVNKGTEETPEYVWEYTGTKKFEVDLTNYVKFTDSAVTNDILQKISSNKFLSPYYIDKIVKVGITTNTETITEKEKNSACEWLGAYTKKNVDDKINESWDYFNIENGEGVGSIKMNKSNCTAKGAFASSSGYYTNANGGSTYSGGFYSIADVEYSISYGISTKTQNNVLAAFGRYNNPTTGHILEVGNGSGNSRSNAFAVLEDGRAKVQSAPVDDDDVVRKLELDNLSNNIDTAMSIAKGRATGYVFDTKEDMDAWLENHENVSNLVLGDNLYIRAVDTPDYWWDGSSAQMLETQKVDLTGYVKKETSSGHLRVYAVNTGGSQTTLKVSQVRDAYSIPRYNSVGNLDASIPNNVYHVANKKYVDDNINTRLAKPDTPTEDSAVILNADGTASTKALSELGGKLYRHVIHISYTKNEEMVNISLEMVFNNVSDAFTSLGSLYPESIIANGFVCCVGGGYINGSVTHDAPPNCWTTSEILYGYIHLVAVNDDGSIDQLNEIWNDIVYSYSDVTFSDAVTEI